MSDQESKKKKKPRDLNLLAVSIIEEAAAEDAPTPEAPEETKNLNAVGPGRLGGLRGGRARAEKLTPERRSEIAKRAAKRVGKGQKKGMNNLVEY